MSNNLTELDKKLISGINARQIIIAAGFLISGTAIFINYKNDMIIVKDELKELRLDSKEERKFYNLRMQAIEQSLRANEIKLTILEANLSNLQTQIEINKK